MIDWTEKNLKSSKIVSLPLSLDLITNIYVRSRTTHVIKVGGRRTVIYVYTNKDIPAASREIYEDLVRVNLSSVCLSGVKCPIVVAIEIY